MVNRVSSIVRSLLLLVVIALHGACSRQAPEEGRAELSAKTSEVRAPASVEDFHTILDEHEIVVVDFYATWCGPCKALKPLVDKLAADYAGQVEFVAVDVDKMRELATSFSVRSIPDVRIFKGGRIAQQLSGVQPESVYRRVLDSLLEGS